MIFLLQLLIVSLAISSVSYTIGKSKIFSFVRIYTYENKKLHGVYDVISCPYCLSHWLTVIAMNFIKPINLFENIFVEYFMLTFACIALSAFWIGIISRAFEFMISEESITDA